MKIVPENKHNFTEKIDKFKGWNKLGGLGKVSKTNNGGRISHEGCRIGT